MAITNKSSTNAAYKDYWRTPPELIDDALKLLNIGSFNTDVCCKDSSVKIEKADYCIEEETDALKVDWFTVQYYSPADLISFCNPPFSKKWQFFQKAVEQVNYYWHSVLMVLPYVRITTHWRKNIDPSNSIVYVPDGRYHFLTKDGEVPTRINKKTGKIEKSSPSFAVCLVLVVPFYTNGAKYINYERGLNGSFNIQSNTN